jgi:hypothetical protein
MALYAFDGTWNQARNNDEHYDNTNVWRFWSAYSANNHNEWDFYWPGVGTRLGLTGRVVGGVFGAGNLVRLNEAYDRLCAAWAAGDRIIDIIGFSRGAAMTLDFCHIIQTRKIRKPGTDTVVEANPTIRFLGVWDIVAAFGLANLGATDLNIGHHLSLPKSNLRYAFHALALDERRPSFLPTRLGGASEVWFRGAHADVGGGNRNRGLNDIALKWMMSKAKAAGLPITDADIAALRPDPTAPPQLDPTLQLDIRLVTAVDRVHYSVSPVAGGKTPPATCSVDSEADERIASEVGAGGLEVLPAEVRARITTLLQTAEDTAAQLDMPLDGVWEALATLIQGRIPLVTNEPQLAEARQAVVRLTRDMVRNAQQVGFHALNEFFLTQALFNLRPLFPFTD